MAAAGGIRGRSLKYFNSIVGVCLALVLAGGVAAGAADGAGRQTPDFVFMPRIGFYLEYGGFLNRPGHDLSSLFRYHLLVDLLQYKRHLLYMEIDCEVSFGVPQDTLAFDHWRHELGLLGYRYDLGNYYIGIQALHRCNNPFKDRGRRPTSLDRNIGNTYFFGLNLVDKALLAGQKNRGIVFDPDKPLEFLGRFHFQLSANKSVFQEFCDLDWLFLGRVRLDLLRWRRMIPYLEAEGQVLGGDEWHFVPTLEGGLRFHTKNVDITPFLRWGRTHEWLRLYYGLKETRFVPQTYLFAGGRLEFALDKDPRSYRHPTGSLEFFPEIHGSAEYDILMDTQYQLGASAVNLRCDLLRWQSLTLFAYLGMDLSTYYRDLGPDKVRTFVDYGLRYAWSRYFLEGFVRHSRRLDAYLNRHLRESAHLAGGRLGTRGMLLGYQNDGIDFKTPASFQWLHKFNAEISLAPYFDTQDWPFLWNLAAAGRWDLLRWRAVVPYLQAGVEYFAAGRGASDKVDWYFEPGLRFHGVLDLAVFYRFQHRETIFSYRGPQQDQSLVGLRVLF